MAYFTWPPPLPNLPLNDIPRSLPNCPQFRCTWFTCLLLRALWDRTGTALSSFFLLLFGSDVFGSDSLYQISRWGGLIYSAWRKDNDLARTITEKHYRSHSIMFRNFQKQVINLRSVLGFDTVAFFACVWHMPITNTTQNKYNPLNRFS